MKILIAYDGSSCADAALKDLKPAGLPINAGSALDVSWPRGGSRCRRHQAMKFVQSTLILDATPEEEKQTPQAIEQAQRDGI